jgi:hypothetical protein
VVRSKLRSGKDGDSLVRTSRLTGDLELLRIVLSGADAFTAPGAGERDRPRDVRFW